MLIDLIQIVIALLLILAIMIQERGSGLGSAFGGEGAVYLAKRGAEKIIFIITIFLAIAFFALGIVRLFF